MTYLWNNLSFEQATSADLQCTQCLLAVPLIKIGVANVHLQYDQWAHLKSISMKKMCQISHWTYSIVFKYEICVISNEYWYMGYTVAEDLV